MLEHNNNNKFDPILILKLSCVNLKRTTTTTWWKKNLRVSTKFLSLTDSEEKQINEQQQELNLQIDTLANNFLPVGTTTREVRTNCLAPLCCQAFFSDWAFFTTEFRYFCALDFHYFIPNSLRLISAKLVTL